MTFVWESGWVPSGTDGSRTREYPGKESCLARTRSLGKPTRGPTDAIVRDLRVGFGLSFALIVTGIVMFAVAITVPASAVSPGVAPAALGIALLAATGFAYLL